MKNQLKLFVYRWFRPIVKFMKTKRKENELKRIRLAPRYTKGYTNILDGLTIEYLDTASFFFMYKEIFIEEIYKFKCEVQEPYIIDAGANIGLAILYLKKQFPKARIVGFEPDSIVFKILQKNVEHLKNIELHEKALWDKDCDIDFYSEGADGGRMVVLGKEIVRATNKLVSAVRLAEYLRKRVDFLKIDIEGSELIVLEDCKDLLNNVERIFVEYHSFIDKNQSLGKLVTILEDVGFRLYITSPGLSQKQPLINVGAYLGMDGQLNIYGKR